MKKIVFSFVLMLTLQHSKAQCLTKQQALESKIKSQRELAYSTKHVPGEPVKDTVLSIRVYRYDEQGNLTEQYEYNADGRTQSKIIFSFDDSRKTIKADSTEGENIISKSFYNYDAKGKLLEKKTQDTSGNLLKQIAFTYNEYGKLREEKCTNDSGKIIYRKVCKYDASGSIIQNDFFNSDSKLYQCYKFNTAGKLSETKTYNSDGSTSSRHSVLFDYADNKSEEDDYDASGKLIQKFTYTCGPFVGPGLWIKQTQFDPDSKPVIIIDREFEFYSQ